MAADRSAHVREALERSEIMALSTIDADGGSWSSPVQYDHEGHRRLTLLSLADARHVANIDRDPPGSRPRFTVVLGPGGNLGLQLRGTAKGEGGPAGGWQRFVITVERFWVFDSPTDRHHHRMDISDLTL